MTVPPFPEPQPNYSSPQYYDWAARQREYYNRARGEWLRGLFARVLAVRGDLGYYVMGYSGSGDEGHINYSGYMPAASDPHGGSNWSEPNELVAPENVNDAIRGVFPDYDQAGDPRDELEHYISGDYANNDGGQGVLVANLRTGEIDDGFSYNETNSVDSPSVTDLGEITPFEHNPAPKEDW